MNEFTDKVILVTGAGRGIGRAIAEAFAGQGAIVAANDINPTNVDETVRRIGAAGGRAKAYVFDVAKRMPVEAMVTQVLEDWQRVDILINNAAVEPNATILEMDEWDWHRTIDVNLSGSFFAMQQVGRAMRQQGGGVVVNICSSAARAHRLPNRAAYVASKTGLLGLTRQAASELAAFHIRVNAVCPGEVETEKIYDSRQVEAAQRKSLGNIPQGRLGKLEDVAGVVLFLCSDAAAYITGQAINVDGGMVMC